jgi:hypothetical protein
MLYVAGVTVVSFLAFACWCIKNFMDIETDIQNLYKAEQRLQDRITKESSDLFQLRSNIEKATKL